MNYGKDNPMTTTYTGIDYGLDMSNVDRETGIRYGVISQYTIGQAWYDSAEPDYGEPTCPQCGNKVRESGDATLFADFDFDYDDSGERIQPDWFDFRDYTCLACKACYYSEKCFSDEALGWSFEDAEYTLTDCLNTDVFVLKSPYYTFAQYCSPCVPGAGNLDTPMEQGNGAKCYALGHEWFWDTELGHAPYRVFRVADGAEVMAEVTK